MNNKILKELKTMFEGTIYREEIFYIEEEKGTFNNIYNRSIILYGTKI